jgi:tRNA G10  N-methylase Trm11
MQEELISYQINKVVPQPLLSQLQKVEGDRAFCSLGKDGINIFIVIEDISKKEFKEFKRDLTVIYQDYQIPFLILKYKTMSFNMPLTLNEPLEGNATNIFIIEHNGYILKQIRRLGLNYELYTAIKEGSDFVKDVDKTTLITTVNNHIYPKYSGSDMCKGGIRQKFKRIF